MKAINIILLILLALAILEMILPGNYYLSGVQAMIIALWYGKKLVDLNPGRNK